MDALGNVIKHTDQGGTIYYKYYAGGALKETHYDGSKTTINIDGWGNKTELNDPSAGIYTYLYDNLGRVREEESPKGITTYDYDNLGRPLKETLNGRTPADATASVKNYYYDDTGTIYPGQVTRLPREVSGTFNGKSFSYTTNYDPALKGRIKGKTEVTPDFTYQTTTSFDTYGRAEETELKTTLKSPAYTSVSKIKNSYDGLGILEKQWDTTVSGSPKLIWQLNEVNSQGKTTQLTYGNGQEAQYAYDPQTKLLKGIRHAKGSQIAMEVYYDYDPIKLHLKNRNNTVFQKNETFEYDNLDRLLKETVNGIVENQYTYDKRGRMTSNTSVGEYLYEPTNYQLKQVNYNLKGKTLETVRGFHEMTFNAFKAPVEIKLAGKDRLTFEYNLFKSRYKQTYKNGTATKFYSSDMAVEIQKEGTKTKIITYIDGNPYSASYIRIEELSAATLVKNENFFLHRDNQSSILALSKANGSIAEQRFFDAWGNLKEYKTATGLLVKNPPLGTWGLLIDRGYTGHEHLWSVGLIHMNGRIYDPELRRFVSPDNYVQDPHNTQSYNRYGYVMNNPLMYVDPSGEEGITLGLAVVIGVAVAIITNGIINILNGTPFWYGMGKSAVMGAVSGAISFGIGSLATSTTTTFIGKAALQAGLHGLSGGMMSTIEGGSFISGFAAGAISSIVSSGIQALGTNFTGSGAMTDQHNNYLSQNGFGANKVLQKAVMIASGGLSGGISSALAGGNFWAGVRQGLITSGLNHAANHVVSELQNGGGLAVKQNSINNRIDNRINEINNDMSENTQKIVRLRAEGKENRVNTLMAANRDLALQKYYLQNAKSQINDIITKSHGYNITLSPIIDNDPNIEQHGTITWGATRNNLILKHNGRIDTIIHEAVHLYQIIFQSNMYNVRPFNAYTKVSIGGTAEINAYKVSYALHGLEGITNNSQINYEFLVNRGYIER